MDIADWLRGLGLEKYAPAFEENAINWDVLSGLTTDDLKEIGVAALGDRRRLLRSRLSARVRCPGRVAGSWLVFNAQRLGR